MRIVPITSFFGLWLLAACSDKRDIQDYYYPLAELRTGMVYAYAVTQNGQPAPAEYWYYRTFARDSGVFLAATYYDRDYNIGQIVREKITPSGAVARNYFLYEQDTATGTSRQIVTRLEAASVFPFQVRDSLGVFLFSLSYQPLHDSSSTISVVRNRRYLGNGPDFEWRGKRYPVVRFALREAIGNTREGTAELEGTGEEHYARGLGLVWSRKSYGRHQITLINRLEDRFPMSELERRAGAKEKQILSDF